MTRSTMTREWVGVQDLAAELGVPIATVYDWRNRGTGPRGHRIGKYVRFRRRDIETWLATRADPEPNGAPAARAADMRRPKRG